MNGPAPRGIAAILCLGIALVSPLSAMDGAGPAGQVVTPVAGGQSTQTVSAPGGPVANCVGAAAKIEKMTREMVPQERALQTADQHLKDAQAALSASAGKLGDSISKPLAKTLSAPHKKALDKYIDDRDKALKDLLLGNAGVSGPKREWLYKTVEDAKTANERLKKSMSVGETLGNIVDSSKSWQAMAEELDKSGLVSEGIDAGLKFAVETGVRGVKLTPTTALAMEGLMLATDITYAGMNEVFTEQDFLAARDNYYSLRSAVVRNRDVLEGLKAACAPSPAPQVQQSPMPIPPAGAQPVTTPAPPPAPVPAPEPAKKKMSAGKRLGIGLGVMAAVGATGLYVANNVQFGSFLDADSPSGSGGSPTVKSFTQWVCQTGGCSGDVTISFPSIPSNGSIIVFSSPASWSGQAVATSKDVTVRLTHAYNLCYGTQSGLAIWNASNANGPATWNISANIPVQCK